MIFVLVLISLLNSTIKFIVIKLKLLLRFYKHLPTFEKEENSTED